MTAAGLSFTLPPKADGHWSRDERSGKSPQREDGDNDCPHQSHLVVLQLDVPALQESLIDEGLNELLERTRRSIFDARFLVNTDTYYLC